MLQALQRWLRPLLSREPMQLIVEGTITETGTHQPRTHLGPKQAPEEAYFTLALSQAQRSDGSTVPVAQVPASARVRSVMSSARAVPL